MSVPLWIGCENWDKSKAVLTHRTPKEGLAPRRASSADSAAMRRTGTCAEDSFNCRTISCRNSESTLSGSIGEPSITASRFRSSKTVLPTRPS